MYLGRKSTGSDASVDSTISSKPKADGDIAKVESYAENVIEKNTPYNPKDDPNHPWVTWTRYISMPRQAPNTIAIRRIGPNERNTLLY